MKSEKQAGNTVKWLVVFGAALLLSGPLYAEAIQGRVVSVDSAAKKMTVEKIGTVAGAAPVTYNVRVPVDAEISGFGSLGKVQVGDEIRLEGTRSGSEFEAQSLAALDAKAAAQPGSTSTY